jgi:hypothetical protein
MIQKCKSMVMDKITFIYAAMYSSLATAMMFGAFPASAAAKYTAPCNNTLAKPMQAVVNPIAGAFIGLKPVFFLLGLAAFLVGGLLSITYFGKNLVRWSMVVGGVLLGFTVVVSFADSMGLADGC